jgi:energy-coupling factor transporter ATP-binding protein EcfA2
MATLEMVLITGMSGSGKSVALHALDALQREHRVIDGHVGAVGELLAVLHREGHHRVVGVHLVAREAVDGGGDVVALEGEEGLVERLRDDRAGRLVLAVRVGGLEVEGRVDDE